MLVYEYPFGPEIHIICINMNCRYGCQGKRAGGTCERSILLRREEISCPKDPSALRIKANRPVVRFLNMFRLERQPRCLTLAGVERGGVCVVRRVN